LYFCSYLQEHLAVTFELLHQLFMPTSAQDSITINDTSYNLQVLETLAWKKLVNGSVKKKNGFRTMCVGTLNENNTAALRIVVVQLRKKMVSEPCALVP
jgi:hypothetical protein